MVVKLGVVIWCNVMVLLEMMLIKRFERYGVMFMLDWGEKKKNLKF